MDNIHKMPFMLGGIMAVVTGITSYIGSASNQTIYTRMAIVMVVFFIIGIFIKNTLITIQTELAEKKKQELIEMAKEEEMNSAHLAEKANVSSENEHKVDLVADDFDEEFSPLTVSRVITSKIQE